jgi:AraC-like DNA-binding protein
MSNAIRVAHGTFGRVALLDMDAPLVRHAHPHCHVLLKAAGADTQFSVRDELVPLTDDCAVLINAWEPHAYVHRPDRPRTIILALYIEPDWLARFRPNWVASGASGFFDRRCGPISPRIRRPACALADAMTLAPEAAPEHERLLSELMIAVIERLTPWRTSAASLGTLARRECADYRIRRAVGLIRQDPARAGRIDLLAQEAGLSRAHFFRLFEQSLGLSPRMFVNAMRMELAVAEVARSGAAFGDVGRRLGFTAPAHFTRFFRDHAGAPPREFRAVSRLDGAF